MSKFEEVERKFLSLKSKINNLWEKDFVDASETMLLKDETSFSIKLPSSFESIDKRYALKFFQISEPRLQITQDEQGLIFRLISESDNTISKNFIPNEKNLIGTKINLNDKVIAAHSWLEGCDCLFEIKENQKVCPVPGAILPEFVPSIQLLGKKVPLKTTLDFFERLIRNKTLVPAGQNKHGNNLFKVCSDNLDMACAGSSRWSLLLIGTNDGRSTFQTDAGFALNHPSVFGKSQGIRYKDDFVRARAIAIDLSSSCRELKSIVWSDNEKKKKPTDIAALNIARMLGYIHLYKKVNIYTKPELVRFSNNEWRYHSEPIKKLCSEHFNEFQKHQNINEVRRKIKRYLYDTKNRLRK